MLIENSENELISALLTYLNSQEVILVLLLVSVATFLGSIILIPWVITRIPRAYFAKRNRTESRFKNEHPVLWPFLFVVRNFLGAVLFVVGLLLLVLPGQGILMIVASTFLLEFPGKYRMQRWLVRRPKVLRSINWLRSRFERRPLEFDD